jgi:hypothetical protein
MNEVVGSHFLNFQDKVSAIGVDKQNIESLPVPGY